jgi:ribosome maturation factor RimP
MIQVKAIESLCTSFLQGSGLFVLEAVVSKNNHIEVYIDGERYVNVEECKQLSRFLEQELEKTDEDFELVVSSAGVSRPMKLPRQYIKNIGRELVLKTSDGSKIEGILVNVLDKGIELEFPVKNPKKEKKQDNRIIPFDQVREAKVVVKFK